MNNQFMPIKRKSSFEKELEKKLKKAEQNTKKYLSELNQSTPPTAGSAIKNNIQNVLSKKYGELDTRNLFDGIDDKDVEANIETAENTIATNIDRGILSKADFSKLPNLRDGLALSFAAANKGDSKATKMAREAAYMEDLKETLVKKHPTSTVDTSKITKALKTDNEKPSAEKLTCQVDKDKFSNADALKTGKFPLFVDGLSVVKISDTQDKSKQYNKKSEYPTSFVAKELMGENKSNNHQFNDVSAEQKRIYEIAEKEGITAAHARIKTYAEQWENIPEYKWTLGDIAKWQTTGGEEFIHQEKLGFIKNYKDVILDAAEKYDIPPILLAGVAYIEYGGKPTIADEIAYYGRRINKYLPNFVDTTFDKDPKLTSYGNTSIQIRRAAETLGYSSYKDGDIIKILKDPIQNIYISAAHLNDLRNIDYLGISADELTEDEIKIIASRYNIGPQYKKESILTQYGEEIYANQADIMNALQ